MNTRKIRVMKAPPAEKMPKPGSWRELLFTRMKPGNCFIAKLGKHEKTQIYGTINYCKARGCFKMKTQANGMTMVVRVK